MDAALTLFQFIVSAPNEACFQQLTLFPDRVTIGTPPATYLVGEGHSRMISKASKFFAMSLLLVSVSALADTCNNFNI